jgi:hemoglobin
MSDASPAAAAAENAKDLEDAIRTCVRRFYGKARQDALLGPVFNAHVTDWEHHFARIDDFWSHVLLGTKRYSGHPYPLHVQLPVRPEHFPRWVALFEETANETLPLELAATAIAKARMMAASFQAGIFPFKDAGGQPSRVPAPPTSARS